MLALMSTQTQKWQRVRIDRLAFCASIKHAEMRVEDNMMGKRDREVAPTGSYTCGNLSLELCGSRHKRLFIAMPLLWSGIDGFLLAINIALRWSAWTITTV